MESPNTSKEKTKTNAKKWAFGVVAIVVAGSLALLWFLNQSSVPLE